MNPQLSVEISLQIRVFDYLFDLLFLRVFRLTLSLHLFGIFYTSVNFWWCFLVLGLMELWQFGKKVNLFSLRQGFFLWMLILLVGSLQLIEESDVGICVAGESVRGLF